ncbi:MAG: hypothetical protein ACJ76J_12065 [Thermoanaerobaculia bacterium]
MSGSTLRRTVLSLVVVALLLPLASAYAAPAGRNGTPLSIQMPDWSRTLVQTVGSFLNLFRLAADADSWPPGQKPGADPDTANREGNGFDPHGKP